MKDEIKSNLRYSLSLTQMITDKKMQPACRQVAPEQKTLVFFTPYTIILFNV